LNQFNFELSTNRTLESVYPEYEWHPWKFVHTPQKFWKDPANHKRYFDWLETELGIRDKNEWYQRGLNEVESRHGSYLLHHFYHSNLSIALMNIYPEFGWKPWLFSSVCDGYWNKRSNVMKFMDWIGEKLGVKELDDWYKVTYRQVQQLGGYHLMSEGGLYGLLCRCYPHHHWNHEVFLQQQQFIDSKIQDYLMRVLHALFNNNQQSLNHSEYSLTPTENKQS
jgi:hypothetical protein